MVTVRIPDEPGLFKTTNLPSRTVRLPLTVGARLQPLVLVLSGSLGTFLPLAAAMLFLAAPPRGGVGTVAAMAVGLFSAAAGLCLAGVALTSIVDDSRQYPLLALDESGLLDWRSVSKSIAWSDIEHARITYIKGGPGGVHLKLRQPVAARHNPFRFGTLGFVWRRRPDELHVPVVGLDFEPRLLAYTITAMVERNGGTAETKPPHG